MNVLFLTPWYPSEADAMAGLFVQKHVEAVRAQGVDVRVISSLGWRDTWRQWRVLRREGWMPDIVQLNVIQKQGLLALWLKKRYKIPYIIIEHWSGYLPDNGQFMRLSAAKQRFAKHVCANAESVLAVSTPLLLAMQACGIQAKQWGTIDNVVDDFFFAKHPKSSNTKEKKVLLHVSCFDERAKNITSLLLAVKLLSYRRKDFELVLVGTGLDYQRIHDYADSLGLLENHVVRFTGELTPEEVAQYMHQSDALVLSSRYETYGVVLAEAAAAGVPILSTPVGIAEEIADIIVPQEVVQNKSGRFAEFIETVLWKTDLPPQNVSLSKRFSAESIGKKLKAIYDSCLHRDI